MLNWRRRRRRPISRRSPRTSSFNFQAPSNDSPGPLTRDSKLPCRLIGSSDWKSCSFAGPTSDSCIFHASRIVLQTAHQQVANGYGRSAVRAGCNSQAQSQHILHQPTNSGADFPAEMFCQQHSTNNSRRVAASQAQALYTIRLIRHDMT